MLTEQLCFLVHFCDIDVTIDHDKAFFHFDGNAVALELTAMEHVKHDKSGLSRFLETGTFSWVKIAILTILILAVVWRARNSGRQGWSGVRIFVKHPCQLDLLLVVISRPQYFLRLFQKTGSFEGDSWLCDWAESVCASVCFRSHGSLHNIIQSSGTKHTLSTLDSASCCWGTVSYFQFWQQLILTGCQMNVAWTYCEREYMTLSF